jgi:hypothetical protein
MPYFLLIILHLFDKPVILKKPALEKLASHIQCMVEQRKIVQKKLL